MCVCVWWGGRGEEGLTQGFSECLRCCMGSDETVRLEMFIIVAELIHSNDKKDTSVTSPRVMQRLLIDSVSLTSICGKPNRGN